MDHTAGAWVSLPTIESVSSPGVASAGGGSNIVRSTSWRTVRTHRLWQIDDGNSETSFGTAFAARGPSSLVVRDVCATACAPEGRRCWDLWHARGDRKAPRCTR